MIVLIFDETTPSLNALHGHHFTKKHRLRMRWHWLVKAEVRRQQIWIPPKWSRATIRVERHGPRLLDFDNARAGLKPLIDSLVTEEIITDDTPAVIGEPELKQFVSKERKTVVYVEPRPSVESA
jgi:hypothetical protein